MRLRLNDRGVRARARLAPASRLPRSLTRPVTSLAGSTPSSAKYRLPSKGTGATSRCALRCHAPAQAACAKSHAFYLPLSRPLTRPRRSPQVLAEARAGNVASVQIATQHDCVVATTPIGHRYASYIKDKDFPNLLIDAMGADGSVPFDVLPMNKRNAAIRMAATQLLDLMGLLYVRARALDRPGRPWPSCHSSAPIAAPPASPTGRSPSAPRSRPPAAAQNCMRSLIQTPAQVADQLDLLPWDSTPYGSLSEREEGRKAWLARDGKSTKPARVWLDKMLASRRGKPKGVAGSKGGEKEEALRRVLGLSKWDAAAELKALKEKMRPRSLERSLLDARPVEIEREIMEARGKIKTSVAAMQAEVHAELADMALRLQEAPWVTPVTLDTTTSLPTLEELCTRAVPVGSDGVGARMYIRGEHPRAEPMPNQASRERPDLCLCTPSTEGPAHAPPLARGPQRTPRRSASTHAGARQGARPSVPPRAPPRPRPARSSQQTRRTMGTARSARPSPPTTAATRSTSARGSSLTAPARELRTNELGRGACTLPASRPRPARPWRLYPYLACDAHRPDPAARESAAVQFAPCLLSSERVSRRVQRARAHTPDEQATGQAHRDVHLARPCLLISLCGEGGR